MVSRTDHRKLIQVVPIVVLHAGLAFVAQAAMPIGHGALIGHMGIRKFGVPEDQVNEVGYIVVPKIRFPAVK